MTITLHDDASLATSDGAYHIYIYIYVYIYMYIYMYIYIYISHIGLEFGHHISAIHVSNTKHKNTG